MFNVDHRVIHTLPPLLLKPGFLTLEYFSGRCVRYIAPFRLMFLLSMLAFFVIHLRMDAISDRIDTRNHAPVVALGNEFKDAGSVREVRDTLRDKLGQLNAARRTAGLPRAALTEMGISAQKIRAQANQRLIALGAAPMPAASLAAPAASASTQSDSGAPARKNDDESGDEKKMPPAHIGWLPGIINSNLTLMGEHMLANWHTFKHGDATAREEAKQRLIGSFSACCRRSCSC